MKVLNVGFRDMDMFYFLEIQVLEADIPKLNSWLYTYKFLDRVLLEALSAYISHQ